MKKRISLFLIMLLIGLTGCVSEKQSVQLPVFEYPLNQEIIAQAIELSDFPIDLTIEENEYMETEGIESSSFTLRHPSKDIYTGRCLGVLSHKAEAFTSVGITVSSIDQDAVFTDQEIEQAIRFATYLFWGDEKETRVYDAFIKEYNPREKIIWEKQIDGIDC